MHTRVPAIAILFALGMGTACSAGGAADAGRPSVPEIAISYVTAGRITVTRPGKRNIVYANSAVGQSKTDQDSPAAVTWSQNGRYVAWSTYHPNMVGVADASTGQVRTWPCPCTNAAFAGGDLVALDLNSRTLLVFSPDGRPPVRRALRGPLAKSQPPSAQIIGADGSGVLVKTETGSKEWHVFRVLATGQSTPIATSLPRIWTGDVHSRSDGTVAFGLASNGAGCGSSDKVAVVSSNGRPSRVFAFPWSPTRWNVVAPEWGADGRLYVSVTKWPPCSGQPSSVTDRGQIWELDGSTWRYTGLSALGFQPISARFAVMSRGTETLSADGLDHKDELVVAGPGGAARVLARSVSDYAVSPRSMTPFNGRHALLPAHPTPPASRTPTPVLGITNGPNQEGFGKVRPDFVYLGGDPTGAIKDVRWQSWGGPTATADATGIYVGENQIVADGTAEPAKVVASDLGYCRGTYAYRSLTWYFPGRGEALDTKNTMNICTGE